MARHQTLIAKGGITGILGRLETRGLVKRMENTLKVAQFSYHDPASLPEALGLLTQLENTRLLAGGQSLLPYLAFRMLRCDHLIDLNAITELAGIQEKDGRLVIGAMTRQREITKQEAEPRVSLHRAWVAFRSSRCERMLRLSASTLRRNTSAAE